MKQRKIGKDMAGEIGLGCMGMSHAYGASDETENLRVLRRALELGCNYWDTADFYGAGTNEALLGKALTHHRSQVFLATKVGNVFDKTLTSHQDQVSAKADWIVDGTPDYIRKSVHRSLQRLSVDVIDLYYLHRVDPHVPIEESVGTLSRLVEEGKVRYIGLSEASADNIRRAARIHPIAALQSEYSLWTRDVEATILPTCRELNIAFVAYAPLGRGFLTGAIQKANDLSPNDWRHTFPRFQEEILDKNRSIVDTISAIAAQHKATLAQIALAWLLAKGGDIIPIPGTRHIKYLEENSSAGTIRLSAEELGELEKLKAFGHRFPENMRKFLDE